MSFGPAKCSTSHFNSHTPSPESSDSSTSSVSVHAQPVMLPKNFNHRNNSNNNINGTNGSLHNNNSRNSSAGFNNRRDGFENNITQHEQQQLPIHLVQRQLLSAIDRNESLIVIGETGCGKTTQIPQFIHQFYRNESALMIGITQPRRVAAISVATRVASEMQTEVGDLVGYAVRFEDQTSTKTRIKYMTDGILLREAIGDPLLTKYNILIIDEAHERTVQTDVLFGILKKAQSMRRAKRKADDGNDNAGENGQTIAKPSPLKLIIMSATMDVDHFSKYFNDAPVYCIAGRTYPIKIFYAEEKESDYVQAALTTIFQIHQEEDEIVDEVEMNGGNEKGKSPKKTAPAIGGDILVFCTGQEEIESMIKTINDLQPHLAQFQTRSGVAKTLTALPLYAALPLQKQQQVFTRQASLCFRRVIIATNIAETSVTIPNIRYVIDTGKVKTRAFSPATGLEVMKVEDIAKAQASQRAGRAGRIAAGQCYRLYPKSVYRTMRPFPVPEIQKCNLANILLQLIAINIQNVASFDFIDTPSADNIECSLEQLLELQAIEEVKTTTDNNNQPTTSKIAIKPLRYRTLQLTHIGQQMVKFPVDPRFAALIIASQRYACTDPILIIISMLSVDSVFFVPNEEREQALRQHHKFDSSEGDLIRLLNVFRRYKENKESGHWCREHFLKVVQLKMAARIRSQLMELCQRVGIPVTVSHNTQVVRQCLVVGAGLGLGLGANVAVLQRETGGYRVLDLNAIATKSIKSSIRRPAAGANDCSPKTVFIHPSSCLFAGTSKPECVLFVELVHTTKSYMRNCSLVDQQWLFAGNGNATSANNGNSSTSSSMVDLSIV